MRRSIVVRFAVGKEERIVVWTKEVIWSPTRGWRPEQIISAIGRVEVLGGCSEDMFLFVAVAGRVSSVW